MARSGFTVPEVLVAAALGAFIMGLTIQQTMSYFRLQQVLMARTQLRNDTQIAQERLAQKLRYADRVYQTDEGFFATLPSDDCADGFVCRDDSYEVLWWQVAGDPLASERTVLMERAVQVKAFAEPSDLTEIKALFKETMGRGRSLAPQMESLEISQDGAAYLTKLVAAQAISRQPEPVRITLSERVAMRTRPVKEGLPTLEERLEELRWGR